MDMRDSIRELGRKARVASRQLAALGTDQKNRILAAMADGIDESGEEILAANSEDVAEAAHRGLSASMIDRLRLDPDRLASLASGVRDVAGLPDPVGAILSEWVRPNGLRIQKKRVPIGVIGIIYESRPNVTSDAAVLCLKTGNAVILRGGSESIRSNRAIARALQSGGERAGLPEAAVQMVPTTDREAVRHMAEMDEFLDLIIPRGGHALIEAVVSHARMPVIKHYHGVCILYVDCSADLAMAAKIAIDAKTRRPSACNSIETILLHRNIAEEFLRAHAGELLDRGVELRCDAETSRLLSVTHPGQPKILPAEEADYRTEFLDLILAVKVVGDLDGAIAHIEKYGSHHSDSIVTADDATAERFLGEVDSATVYWNASTRFTDGNEFGFGAEIGISTDKLHARGPMGLEELTTYKYLIRGDGQIRQ